LHRDIKPSNLMMDAHGTVWVTDFGLAKTEGSDGPTRTGDIVGTLRYMAPERFEGHADSRSDLYALGATLYELLTLHPAFDDPNQGRLIEQVLHREPAAPRVLDPRIPRDLELICQKCLSKEPAGRYGSAAELAEELRRFLAGEPIRARRASAAERAWRWCRRNPLVAGLVGGIALALILGTVVSAYFALRANQKAVEARANARQALQEMRRASQAAQKALAEAARADQEAQHARDEKRRSDHHRYLAEMSMARRAWIEGQA
jgi:hypothetical protein